MGVTGSMLIYDNSIYNTRDGIYPLVPATVLNNAINAVPDRLSIFSGAR